MSAFHGAVLAAIVALFCWAWWRSRVRASEIRRLAESNGFHYLDNTLPESLLPRDLPVGITSVWNVLEGERQSRRVLAFDCRFGEGKRSWRRTVIAVRADRSSITAFAFDPDIQVEQIGQWTFLYRPKAIAVAPELTPVNEIAAYLDAV